MSDQDLPKNATLWYAYADDSYDDEGVVCAAAIFAADKALHAEAELIREIESIGLPAEAELHCKILFNGDRRKKHPLWSKASWQQINNMVEQLCQSLKGISHQPLACILPTGLPAVPPSEDGQAPAIVLTKDGIAAFGYQMILDTLKRNLGQVKVWGDPNSSKIPWGGSYRQADLVRSISIDLGPGREIEWVNTEPDIGKRQRLIEVADLYAYVVRRASSQKGGKKNRFFQSLYEIISPAIASIEPNPNPRWVRR